VARRLRPGIGGMRSAAGVQPSNRKQALTSMKVTRPWFGIVTLSFAVALALALVIGALGTVLGGAGTPPATQAGEPSAALGRQQTYEGMVTDSRCGAKHQSVIGKTATDCTRACVHAGSQFALVDGDNTYLLEGHSLELKRAAGLRSTITGTLRGNTIVVSSVAGT
jgi:hypothetical protein